MRKVRAGRVEDFKNSSVDLAMARIDAEAYGQIPDYLDTLSAINTALAARMKPGKGARAAMERSYVEAFAEAERRSDELVFSMGARCVESSQ